MKKENEKSDNADEVGEAPPVETESDTYRELKAENEALRAEIRLADAREKITRSLTEAGARSPVLLFDSAIGDLQFDDDGGLVNAAAIVKELTRRFPEQFGADIPAGSIDAGAGRTVEPALTAEQLAKMKPAEIAALDWAEVRRVLAAS